MLPEVLQWYDDRFESEHTAVTLRECCVDDEPPHLLQMRSACVPLSSLLSIHHTTFRVTCIHQCTRRASRSHSLHPNVCELAHEPLEMHHTWPRFWTSCGDIEKSDTMFQLVEGYWLNSGIQSNKLCCETINSLNLNMSQTLKEATAFKYFYQMLLYVPT